MSKRFDTKHLIAFIPYRIEPDQYERFGPLLAGFPRNILLPRVQRSKSGEVFGIVASLYEPDPLTFVETDKCRELTYRNKAGGLYTLKVVLNTVDGSLEARKYKGEKLVACAFGNEFTQSMLHVGLMGVATDEPVSFIENWK